jgi:hypothetical protein
MLLMQQTPSFSTESEHLLAMTKRSFGTSGPVADREFSAKQSMGLWSKNALEVGLLLCAQTRFGLMGRKSQ